MQIYTKASLIAALKRIHDMGWVENTTRKTNQGAIGNLLEDYLGIEENNLPLPNANEWELKTWRKGSTSLLTLLHKEPSPRTYRFVPRVLLPKYGWAHQDAGTKYHESEMSFRQTITTKYSDRGFCVVADDENRHIRISFNASMVNERHSDWLKSVELRVGLGELDPAPYWGYDDVFYHIGSKLGSTVLVGADRKSELDSVTGERREYFYYNSCLMLKSFSIERFLDLLREGAVYVDFDARTGHNHGTKFRMNQNRLSELYAEVEEIF